MRAVQPRAPAWWLPRLRPLLRAPERRLGSEKARGGHASPPHEDLPVSPPPLSRYYRASLRLVTLEDGGPNSGARLAIGDLARQSHALVLLFQLSDAVSPLVGKSEKASAVGPAGGRRPLRPPWAIRRLGPLPR